jgi:hypothetical protein
VDLSRRGDSEAAASRLLRGFELLRAVDSGLLASTLIARSERSVLFEAALRVVAENPAMAPVLRHELEPELTRLARESSCARSVVADLAWFLQDCRERSRLSRSWRERFAIAEELHEHLDEIEAGESILFELLHDEAPDNPWTVDLGETRVVPSRSWVDGERHSRTRLQLVRLILALLVHHERTDEWPRGLDELAPLFPEGVPTDPATGSSFCYERTPIGFHLSAAGTPPTGAPEDVSPLWRGEIAWPDAALER